MKNTIYSINGPVVTIKGKTDLEMMEMVYVGKARLVGEVIRMNDRETTIQVYEETGGLKAGEPVESTGRCPSPSAPASCAISMTASSARCPPSSSTWAASLSAVRMSRLWTRPPSGM